MLRKLVILFLISFFVISCNNKISSTNNGINEDLLKIYISKVFAVLKSKSIDDIFMLLPKDRQVEIGYRKYDTREGIIARLKNSDDFLYKYLLKEPENNSSDIIDLSDDPGIIYSIENAENIYPKSYIVTQCGNDICIHVVLSWPERDKNSSRRLYRINTLELYYINNKFYLKSFDFSKKPEVEYKEDDQVFENSKIDNYNRYKNNKRNITLVGRFIADYEKVRPLLFLYNDWNFKMNINLCQGMKEIEGYYYIENNMIVLKLKPYQFKGFQGDDQSEFKLKIISDNKLAFEGDIGCAPSNGMFFFKQ